MWQLHSFDMHALIVFFRTAKLVSVATLALEETSSLMDDFSHLTITLAEMFIVGLAINYLFLVSLWQSMEENLLFAFWRVSIISQSFFRFLHVIDLLIKFCRGFVLFINIISHLYVRISVKYARVLDVCHKWDSH